MKEKKTRIKIKDLTGKELLSAEEMKNVMGAYMRLPVFKSRLPRYASEACDCSGCTTTNPSSQWSEASVDV